MCGGVAVWRGAGAIIIGGGIVKHHIMNANLMRNGCDHAILINTGQVPSCSALFCLHCTAATPFFSAKIVFLAFRMLASRLVCPWPSRPVAIGFGLSYGLPSLIHALYLAGSRGPMRCRCALTSDRVCDASLRSSMGATAGRVRTRQYRGARFVSTASQSRYSRPSLCVSTSPPLVVVVYPNVPGC